MTANFLTLLLIPIGVLAVVLVGIYFSRKEKKNRPPQTHAPHAPGPGYDPAELAISKGKGCADGGVN
ncbi:MAG: hypothetical protein AAGE61_13185 [Pseudomonadota bacterium]